MGRKGKICKGPGFLPEFTKEELVKMYRKEKNHKAQLRLLACIHRKEGKTQEEIAKILYKPLMTVHDWLNRVFEGGIESIYDKAQPGAPRKLTYKQLEKLEKVLMEKPAKVRIPSVIWTTKLVRYYIRKRFGVNYHITHIRRILKSLNFTAQKPRPTHKKANKKLQKEFKKTFEKGLKNIEKTDTRSFQWTKVSSPSNHT